MTLNCFQDDTRGTLFDATAIERLIGPLQNRNINATKAISTLAHDGVSLKDQRNHINMKFRQHS